MALLKDIIRGFTNRWSNAWGFLRAEINDDRICARLMIDWKTKILARPGNEEKCPPKLFEERCPPKLDTCFFIE